MVLLKSMYNAVVGNVSNYKHLAPKLKSSHWEITLHLGFPVIWSIVSLDCYNEYHRLSGLNNRNLFLIILEARRPWLEVQDQGAILVGFLMRTLLACRQPPSCCILT